MVTIHPLFCMFNGSVFIHIRCQFSVIVVQFSLILLLFD
jgi:hypothetical protein